MAMVPQCLVKSGKTSYRCRHVDAQGGRNTDRNGQLDVPKSILSSLLQECIKNADVAAGRCAHDLIIRDGLESNAFLGSRLIRLFASHGYLLDANQVFSQILKPNVFAWSAIISAHANLGQGEHAIKLYHMMKESHVEPDNHVLVAALKACANVKALKHGKLMHQHIVEIDLELDGYVASSLIDVYAKCGALEDACRVFNGLCRRDVVTWGVMIGAYAQHGHGQEALRLHQKMLQEGMEVDRVTFLCTLRACASIAALEQVKVLHDHMLNCGVDADRSVGNALVDTYAKCGSLEDARRVFTSLPNRDVVTWSAMIEGCVQHGDGEDALQLFHEMQREKIEPDRVVTMSILKACSNASSLYHGKLIHSYIIINRFESDLLVGCSIIDMYAKCGSLDDARRVFNTLPYHNVVIWNTMITGCIQHGRMQEATYFFQQMLQQCIRPNQVSFVCILKVCSSLLDLNLGMLTHAYFIESGLELSVLVINTLTDMYAKCGNLDDANEMFDQSSKRDVVTWGVIISGFVQHGHFQEGCRWFQQMLGEGLKADEVAFLGVLKACSSIGDLGLGKLVHAHIIEMSCDFDTSIGNTLIDLYGKSGSFDDAQAVFEALQERDVITYNSMIAACVHYNRSQESLQLLQQMGNAGMAPTEVTFVCILSACANIAALDYGKLIHSHIIETGVEGDVFIGNALVGMYGKCGSLEAACKVFNKCCIRDVVTWNAIIAGCAQHSLYELAMDYFEQMRGTGLNPDGVTFLSLLSACAHAGLVDEGRYLFKSMKKDYGLAPTLDHYSCVLDLLGRAGRLNEAADFLDCTPFETNLEGRTSLLSHCKENGNVELGHQCFDQFIKLDNSNAAGYVLMSHAYSHAGMQSDAYMIEDMRRDAYAWKKPGWALIQIGNRIHDFIVGDRSFSQTDDVETKLKQLSFHIRREGYMPSLDLVLQPFM